MNAGIDFLMLYKELRLRPGCALDEFRHAYRRRVAELHPDRVQHHLYEDAAARLSSLNAMYTAAMEFHKQHGRLPGELASYRPQATAQRAAPQPPPSGASGPPTPVSQRSWLITALLVLAALVVGWILGAVEKDDGDDGSATSSASPARVAAVDQEMPLPRPRLRVGMDSDRVFEIEGEPVLTGVDRWEYGPSWITFHCGSVLDWYSSPLRPLKVDSAQAPADEVERESQLRVPGCVKSLPSG
jgi:hypothetical protein